MTVPIQYIPTTTVFIVTKPSRVLSYLEGLLAIKSRGLVKSHDKLETIPLPQCLWLTNLAGW